MGNQRQRSLEGSGSGGTGFGCGTTASVAILAGTYPIEIIYDEGNGGWGIVGQYSFTNASSQLVIHSSLAKMMCRRHQLHDQRRSQCRLHSSNPVTVSSTTSSLTLNASTGVTFDAAPAALTMSDASNLTVNGTTPSVTFTTTVLNGSLTITANTPVEAGIVSNGGSPAFSSLMMVGSSQLLLDNHFANTAFVTGTVIHANADYRRRERKRNR